MPWNTGCLQVAPLTTRVPVMLPPWRTSRLLNHKRHNASTSAVQLSQLCYQISSVLCVAKSKSHFNKYIEKSAWLVFTK
jgi:hypothetical protein